MFDKEYVRMIGKYVGIFMNQEVVLLTVKIQAYKLFNVVILTR